MLILNPEITAFLVDIGYLVKILFLILLAEAMSSFYPQKKKEKLYSIVTHSNETNLEIAIRRKVIRNTPHYACF